MAAVRAAIVEGHGRLHQMRKKSKLIPQRSRRQHLVAGVCGGLAEAYGFDVITVRAVFGVLLLPGGLPGLVPYLFLWAIMPDPEANDQSN